jgi:hypothetical protein
MRPAGPWSDAIARGTRTLFREPRSGSATLTWGYCHERIVYVLTAWNERTGEDVVQVFSDKSAANKAWERFADRPEIYGAVYRRTVKS